MPPAEDRIRAELTTAIAQYGAVPDQDHAPALYNAVLRRVAEACNCYPADVLKVHRAMWEESKR